MTLDKLPKSYTETCISKGKTYVRKHVKEICGNEARGYEGSYVWRGGCLPCSSVYTASRLTREEMEKQLLENLNKEINRDKSKYYDSVEYSFEW